MQIFQQLFSHFFAHFHSFFTRLSNTFSIAFEKVLRGHVANIPESWDTEVPSCPSVTDRRGQECFFGLLITCVTDLSQMCSKCVTGRITLYPSDLRTIILLCNTFTLKNGKIGGLKEKRRIRQ